MAININSDASARVLQELGENPDPVALLSHARQYLGYQELPILDIEDRVRYVVTLQNLDEQDNFYDEMESAGSRGYGPERVVECAERMPTLRSTTYLLSTIEAARLELDPRVMAVEAHPEVSGIKPRPFGYEYSDAWDKSGVVTSQMKNWGLLRSANRAQISGWGSNGTANQTAQIVTTSTGKNVDVVIFDGNIPVPGHPEFSLNVDGTGGSRVNQINWWAYNPQVTGQEAGVYNYSAGSEGNNGHGIHVAGIMAGNTQGWARDSTIYNISPYGEQTNGVTTPTAAQLVAYIRYWHNNIKGINLATGRKNPTVVNMSFGLYNNYLVGPTQDSRFPNVSEINYRGIATSYPASAPAGQTELQAIYNGKWSAQTFLNNGFNLYPEYYNLYQIALIFSTGQNTAMAEAIVDSMNANEGIIWCAAAGNNWDTAGMNSDHPDYNNTNNFLYTIFLNLIPLYETKYPYRLPTPAFAATGTPNTNNWKKVMVTVNIGTETNEAVDGGSSVGSACDICSPGTQIMSAYNNGVPDPRNANYYLNKLSGTSMASPQTAGLIACMMEQYPNATQMEARTYIKNFANNGVMFDSNIQCPPNNPVLSLRGAPNQVATYYPDRPPTGNPWPQARSWLRPASGAMYPRPTIQRRNVDLSALSAPALDKAFRVNVRYGGTSGVVVSTTDTINIQNNPPNP